MSSTSIHSIAQPSAQQCSVCVQVCRQKLRAAMHGLMRRKAVIRNQNHLNTTHTPPPRSWVPLPKNPNTESNQHGHNQRFCKASRRGDQHAAMMQDPQIENKNQDPTTSRCRTQTGQLTHRPEYLCRHEDQSPLKRLLNTSAKPHKWLVLQLMTHLCRLPHKDP